MEDKKFYSPKEIVERQLLPYKNVQTIRRMVRSGHIRVMRSPTERSFMFIPAEEVDRLRGTYETK